MSEQGALEQLAALVAAAVAPRLAELVAARMPAPVLPEPWRLLDVAGVSAMLGRSERWVRDRAKDGSLPRVRLDGGPLAFDIDDVKAFARERRIPELPAGPRLRAVGE